MLAAAFFLCARQGALTGLTRRPSAIRGKASKTLRDAGTPYIALSLFMRPEHAASNIDHAEILDHYRQRDVARAKELEINHLEATLAIIVEAIENSGPGQVVVAEAQRAG